MKKNKIRNVALFATIVVVATILATSAQVVSASIPAMKLPLEPGYQWGITCGYDGTGGGICATTHTGKDRYALDFNLNGENDNGKSVRAIASGTATVKYNAGGYGYYVDVDHGDGYISRYAHLQATPTVSGYIMQGTEVGKLGRSGAAEGSHLHFVLYRMVNGQLTAVKPEPMSGYTGFKASSGPYYSDNYGVSITVTYPNGGETWRLGTFQPIQWSYTGNPGSSVKVEFVKSTGATTTIGSQVPIGNNGKGAYLFWVFRPAGAGSYKVKITTASGASDMSNGYFTIP